MMDPFGGVSYDALHRALNDPCGAEILRRTNGGRGCNNYVVERIIERPVPDKKKKKKKTLKKKELEAFIERKVEEAIDRALEKILAKKFGIGDTEKNKEE